MFSRRRVYDNWEKLVEATLKRELYRELALCPSFSSSSSSSIGSSSIDLSLRFDDSPTDLDASSSSQEVVVVGNSSSNGAVRAGQFAARLAAPAIALVQYITRKPTHKDKEIELRHIKKISLRELEVASDYFSYGNIIGYGRDGSVYKGRLADGSLVAVKILTLGGELEFKKEVQIARMTMHPNLLGLLGICKTPTKRMLVYPYMYIGTVTSFLRGRSNSQNTLDWSKRKHIAVGSARGLAYLHGQCIIHGDVRAANILLDEDFEAVIGCFGMALILDHKDTPVTNNFSEIMDVYGYGILLLALITGQVAGLTRLANDDDMILDGVKLLLKEKMFPLETLVDANLQGNYIDEEVKQLTQVALLCTQDVSPSKCPKMSEVVRILEGDDLALAERWEDFQNEQMLISDSISDYNHTDYMPASY